MCRSVIVRKTSPHDDIHAACQDRNCSAATIRRLVDEAGVEVLERKDVYGRVVSVLPVIRVWLADWNF